MHIILAKSSRGRHRATAPNSGGMSSGLPTDLINHTFDSPLPTTQPKEKDWLFTQQLPKLCGRLPWDVRHSISEHISVVTTYIVKSAWHVARLHPPGAGAILPQANEDGPVSPLGM